MSAGKILFSVFMGGLLFLCACRTTPQEPSINVLQVATMEKLPAEKAVFDVAPYIKGGLPMPADRLMLYIRENLPDGAVPKLYFSNDKSIITEYNRYAAEKIFSGEDFDILKERQQFLNRKAGKTAKILLEYFRVIERRSLNTFFHAKLENRQAAALDFYHTDSLQKPEQILKKGLNRKVYSKKEVDVIRKELKFYQECKRSIAQTLQKEVPTVIAGDGKWHRLNFRSGKPSPLEAKFKVDLTPEKDSVVFRVFAEEPEMAARKITGTKRDYSKAWSDDCFEIFIVPEPEKPGKCIQFIITSGGVLYDTEYNGLSPVHNPAWNTSGSCKVDRKEKSWEITLTIPWQDFGFDKKPSAPFLTNVFRYRVIKGKKPVSYTWCPIKSGGNFQPKKFGFIAWEE